MLAIIIAMGLLWLLTLSIGDLWGALTFTLVLVILSWVRWGEREQRKEKRPS